MAGTLMYGAIVIISNLKLMQDSHSYSMLAISVNLFSIMSFIGVFYTFSSDKQNDLFKHFNLMYHFPQFVLCLGFFAIAMWPVNQTYFFNIFKSKSEEMKQQDKIDKLKREQEQQDMEDRQ